MYAKNFQESLKAVEAARAANIAYEPARMTADEKDRLLAAYHPDYKRSEFATLRIGPNKGEQVPHELCEMLEAHSRIKADDIDLNDIEKVRKRMPYWKVRRNDLYELKEIKNEDNSNQ